MFILRTPQRTVTSLRPNLRPLRCNFHNFGSLAIRTHTLPLHTERWRDQMRRENFSHFCFTSFTLKREYTTTETKTEEPQKNDDELEGEDEPAPPPHPVDPKDQKIAELNQMIGELRSSLRTSVAEMDNVRKRMQKEIDKAKEFGVEKLVKNMFPLLDTINICLQNKPNLDQGADNIDARIAFDALETTKHQFLAIFKDTCSVEEFIPNVGDNFDPNFHNALFEVDPPSSHPNIPSGTIGLVVKSGWKRNTALLREASVGVVKYRPMDIPEAVKRANPKFNFDVVEAEEVDDSEEKEKEK